MPTRAQRLLFVLAAAGVLSVVLLRASGGQPPATREDAYRANNIGVALLEQYNHEEAAKNFRRALEIDPNSSNVRLSYGACLMASGKLNEAIRYLEDSVKADPTFVWLHSVLARGYGLRNDWAGSVEQRAIAQELQGEHEKARLMRESFAKGGRDGFLRETNAAGTTVIPASPSTRQIASPSPPPPPVTSATIGD